MTSQRARELLAEADRHRAEAAEHLRRAAESQIAYGAAKDQARRNVNLTEDRSIHVAGAYNRAADLIEGDHG